MSKKRQPPLFYRSFYLTLGGLLLILPFLIWVSQGSQSGDWPIFAWFLFFCLPIIGVALVVFGIIASNETIDSIHIVATPGNLFIAALAVPLYLVLSGFRRKKRGKSLRKKHGHVV